MTGRRDRLVCHPKCDAELAIEGLNDVKSDPNSISRAMQSYRSADNVIGKQDFSAAGLQFEISPRIIQALEKTR